MRGNALSTLRHSARISPILMEAVDEVEREVQRLRELLWAVTPTRMGATPDLAWPEGYKGDDPWGAWEQDVLAVLDPYDFGSSDGER